MLAGLAERGSAPPQAVRDCFYNPSTTSWSPSPYTGEALIKPSPVGICKYAQHACRRRRDGFGNREAVGGICERAKHTCRRRRDGFGNRGAVRFSSIFSPLFYLKKIPAGAGIFIAFILPNKRQIRRQSERQRRLQSPMRRYRRARGECLSGRRPRRTCPSAYVREFSRFSESASHRRS